MSTGGYSWIIPAVTGLVFTILLTILLRFGFWRWIVSLSPFPLSFKVFSKKAHYKCFKRDISTFGYAFEYQIDIEVELKPWVIVNMHDFT